MIHLTQTGYYAGHRLCQTARDDGEDNAHAMHAPLDDAGFRAKCCPVCLKTWAVEAYDDGDEMPDWVRVMRGVKDPRQAEEAAAFTLQHTTNQPTAKQLPIF